ncbi:FixH family protein [Magnetococcus sp. PR-3]|uniref:FixH family protein n=1 Tax=Magnetococcus sp. PR-3 TaxID=3120355 RepID=UPI002FCE240D
MSQTEEKAPRFSGGKPWAIAAIIMAVTVISANGINIYMGQKTKTGMVTEGKYKKGMTFDKEVEQGKKQRALGWHVVQDSSQLAVKQEGPVYLTIKDKSESPVSGAQVLGRLIRPIGADHDVDFSLAESKPGVYVGLVTPPLIGAWYLQISITRGEDLFRFKERIDVVR